MPNHVVERRPFFLNLHVLAVLILAVGFNSAVAQDRAAREQAMLEEARQVLGIPRGEVSDEELRASLREFLDHREQVYQTQKQNETVTIDDAVDSVSTVARCAEGYVASHRVAVGAEDVKIAAATRVDCDDIGCKAVQADAQRGNSRPFSVTVSVNCSV